MDFDWLVFLYRVPPSSDQVIEALLWGGVLRLYLYTDAGDLSMDVGGLSYEMCAAPHPSFFTLTLPSGDAYDYPLSMIRQNDSRTLWPIIFSKGVFFCPHPYRLHRYRLRKSQAMEYTVVFDIASAGYRTWALAAFGLPFVLIGALMLKFYKYLPGWPVKSLRFKKGVAICCLGFCVIWTSVAFFTTYSQYRSLITALERGAYQTAQGVVTDFVPMDNSGHSYESFTVDGKTFEYSDYVVTAGFNRTQSQGGPIRDGLKVRITYVDNVIIRLEVASQQFETGNMDKPARKGVLKPILHKKNDDVRNKDRT